MIEELRISGIGVIDQATIRFAPGLTVLSGETGAGKTMVLTGLTLVTGGRSDPQLVRAGMERAVAEAIMSGPGVEQWAQHVGGTSDDGAVIVARTVPKEGRARAFLAGRSVPAAQLAEFAAQFVTVHGQAEQQRLRSPGAQRDALDELAQLTPLRARCADAYQHWRELTQRLLTWEDDAAARARERTALEVALAEIDSLAPEPGEDDTLRRAADRLTNAAEITQAVALASELIAGGDEAPGAVDAIARAAIALSHAGSHDPALQAWAGQLTELNSAVSSIAAEIGEYLTDFELDPAALDEIHERRAALTRLMRRWGPTLDDVLAWAQRARTRLGEFDSTGQDQDQLRAEVADARSELESIAHELHRGRTAAAAQLSKMVEAELHRLAMKSARFGVVVTETEVSATGADRVEMTLQPHPDAPILPVAQSASGGELSRVMLALEVALESTHEHTYVFDEVDAGIGGATATEVAARLKDLAAHHQVIVVSHLPQLAAVADRHLLISKTGATTTVTELSGQARVRELARMLAGDESPTALRHAVELLQRGDVGR